MNTYTKLFIFISFLSYNSIASAQTYSANPDGTVTVTISRPDPKIINAKDIQTRQGHIQQAIEEKNNELQSLENEDDNITQVLNDPNVKSKLNSVNAIIP